MARDRRNLSKIFREIVGINNVYFQKPGPNGLKYPCIIYDLDDRYINYADNRNYKDMNRFTVTLIGRDPDNDELIDRLLEIPYCSMDRRFVSDNLYHDVFNLYY